MKPFITINLSHKKIPVISGKSLVKFGKYVRALAPSMKYLVITNPSIRKIYGARINRTLKHASPKGAEINYFEIPSGEERKNLSTVREIYQRCVALGLDRSSVIIALGGGVVGDVAGFAAGTLFRGIRYVQVPTTLLAMVDSSIGGKVGVDLPEGKNLVGAFYQPEFIFTTIEFLRSLPPDEIRNGIGEIIKYGVISDRWIFEYLEKSQGYSYLDWRRVVERCIKIKSSVVEKDEKETKGIREILNFGHTYAHALEKATSYKRYTHGEAVALGVVMESRLAQRLTGFKEAYRVKNLVSAFGLPYEPPTDIGSLKIASALLRDKKIKNGIITLPLPLKIGEAKYVRVSVTSPAVSELAASYC